MTCMPNSQLWSDHERVIGVGGWWSESSLSSAVCRLSSHWLEREKKVKLLSRVRLWLVGGEVIGWCSRNLQHNLKLPSTWVGASVPVPRFVALVVSDSLQTPWTAALQASRCMGFSRQEYWSGLLCPPPGDLLNPGIEPSSPTLQADSLQVEPPGK